MENQVYHVQQLLVDEHELDNYKRKENQYVEEHIKEIQDAYKQEDIIIKTLQIINKGKQRVKEEKVFLYKSYNVDKSRSKTSEP